MSRNEATYSSPPGGGEAIQTVIFLHIGKTGGSTLLNILRKNFSRQSVLTVFPSRWERDRLPREDTIRAGADLPLEVRAGARLVTSQSIYGLHELFPQPSTYVTMLREPVGLVLSQYRYILRNREHWLHPDVRRMSLADYATSGISLEADNSQVRAISGDTSTPFGRCSEEMLERAKRNIARHFATVGLTERFDESLVLLSAKLGLRRLTYVRVMTTPKRFHRETVPQDTLSLIREVNRFDTALHAHAAQAFEDAINQTPEFAPQLRRLRRANSIYAPWGHLTYGLPRRISRKLRGKPV